MLMIFSLFCLVMALIYLYLNRNRNYWRNRDVVQHDGVMWNFITGNRSFGELYKEIYDKYPDEKHVGLVVGSRVNLLLKDLDDIQFVIQSDFQNFHSRGLVTNPSDVLANNLLFMNNYPRWKLLRQKISPVFTPKKLKNMFYIMERCARDFVEIIEDSRRVRREPFKLLYTYTTASIGASVFGIDTHSKSTMDCQFMDMSWEIFEPKLLDNLKLGLANVSPFLFKILNISVFGKFENFFIGVFKTVLESRQKSRECRYDFINTCLELQQSGILKDSTTGYELAPSVETLVPQAFFFFIAGVDPTASTMNYTLLELSCNPDILERVHKEIDTVLINCKDTISYEDIDKLVYLDMVINESMRKYPPITVIQRVCTNSTFLPSGLKVEKDTVAQIPIFAIHKDEKYYTEPERYNPDRFAPNNDSYLHKNAFLPFGGGNRICIGPRFARIQIKVGLAMLLRRFTLREQEYRPLHFEPSSFGLRDTTVTYDLILRSSC